MNQKQIDALERLLEEVDTTLAEWEPMDMLDQEAYYHLNSAADVIRQWLSTGQATRPAHIQAYVAVGGIRCPYCDSPQIEGGPWFADAGVAWQEMSCSQCHRSWEDLYDLTDVREFSPPSSGLQPDSIG